MYLPPVVWNSGDAIEGIGSEKASLRCERQNE